LTKATIREKKSRKILVASGALKRSYSIRGDSNQRLSVTPTGIALDSSVEYGEYHQTGAGHNPKREFIKFYPQDHARWTKMIEKDLMAAYRGGRTR
jgi:phage gpG-like protein